MAPGPLAQVLRQLPTVEDPNLLTAGIHFADAGVYRIPLERIPNWPSGTYVLRLVYGSVTASLTFVRLSPE